MVQYITGDDRIETLIGEWEFFSVEQFDGNECFRSLENIDTANFEVRTLLEDQFIDQSITTAKVKNAMACWNCTSKAFGQNPHSPRMDDLSMKSSE